MTKAIGKAERLLELEMLLATYPNGMRKSEIAQRLSINRSTAGRYITELTGLIPLVEEDDGRLWIDQKRYLRLVRLSAQEIESIRLAFRLFRRKIRLPFPHAAAALRALALAAERSCPDISRDLLESAESLDARAFPRFTRRYRDAMERLIEASADARTVLIRHRSRRRGAVDEYRFQPYCLEPYPDGNSLHAIGFCLDLKEMRTFKLERIESVKPTEEHFEKPVDFDVDDYTSKAWGIWNNRNRESVPIVLRFSSAVADRVQETVWHDSQRLEPLPGGGVMFRASVGEPLEMYPWIRGWGADVEILEPAKLRERFRKEVVRLREMYAER
jgi:predicted DNA-binding transcriptional regulator YafY